MFSCALNIILVMYLIYLVTKYNIPVIPQCLIDGFEAPWRAPPPPIPMYDFTTRLNTNHLSANDPRELCRAYTPDVYSPTSECI